MRRDERTASERTLGRPAASPDTAAGVALVAGSAVAYSTAGLFTRWIDVDLWTLICWRGVFSTLFLLTVGFALYRGGTVTRFRSLDRAGWLAAGFSTAAMLCYLAALRATTVADVAIIYGTAPFVTAAIAVLVLGERASRATLLCSVLALAGVVAMFGGSHLRADLGGDALAAAMTVFMALMIIATRRSRGAPALPIAALSSLAGSVLAAPLAHLGSPTGPQLAELALFGAGQLGLGLLLLTAGSRLLSASRVALVGGLDVPLAPLWVWLAFDETPTAATIAGGLAVIAAVVLNTLLSSPARQPTPVPARIAAGVGSPGSRPPHRPL